MSISLTDIIVHTKLRPGDIGHITYLLGHLYNKEYDYGIRFKTYVAQGLCEFYQQYDAKKNCMDRRA